METEGKREHIHDVISLAQVTSEEGVYTGIYVFFKSKYWGKMRNGQVHKTIHSFFIVTILKENLKSGRCKRINDHFKHSLDSSTL